VYRQAIGRDADRELFAPYVPPHLAYASVRRERDDYMLRVLRGPGFPLKPGVHELFDALDARSIPFGLATSTHRAMAEEYLRRAGLLSRFACAAYGDMITNGKPDAEIFLTVCGQLDVAPGRCAVVEDSPYGILGAHRAGMAPIMVPDVLQPDGETRALLYALCDSLLDVIPLLD